MDKYIKSDNVLDIISSHYQPKNSGDLSDGYNLGLKAIASCIANLPGEDVASVVHAYWKPYRNTYICSHCSSPMGAFVWSNFCPNCGAKMDEE